MSRIPAPVTRACSRSSNWASGELGERLGFDSAAWSATATSDMASPHHLARDIVGISQQVAAALQAHCGVQSLDEVVFALPFGFDREDYAQILTDMAERLGPALGWRPEGSRPSSH